MTPDLAQNGFSAVVYDEVSRMAWEFVIRQHPASATELHFVWGMVQRAAQRIMQDPVLSAELYRRVQQTTREIAAQWNDENYGYTGGGTGDEE